MSKTRTMAEQIVKAVQSRAPGDVETQKTLAQEYVDGSRAGARTLQEARRLLSVLP